MRRIMVMGPPGGGKSTLARQLAACHGVPVFHLDQAYHLPGWVPAPRETFRAEVERIAALPGWVIDGNYSETIDCRLRAADTLIYLDIPAWLTLARILRRIATSYGQERVDMASGCREQLSLEFLHFAWNWNRLRRARSLARVAAFPGRRIVLQGAAQQRAFQYNGFPETD
jgi:adenylate kinase family enzyme